MPRKKKAKAPKYRLLCDPIVYKDTLVVIIELIEEKYNYHSLYPAEKIWTLYYHQSPETTTAIIDGGCMSNHVMCDCEFVGCDECHALYKKVYEDLPKEITTLLEL